MTTTSNTKERLRLGIEAARAGQKDTARAHLGQVLKQQPNNVPALFWLAYVAASPQESVTLLERVLALDPENERAKKGIHWAKKRLESAAAEAQPNSDDPQPGPAQASEEAPEMPDEFIREQLLSKEDIQKRAKKGVKAHKARRTIDPLLTVALVLAAAAISTLGIWMLALAPAETLAAWLPVSARNTPGGPESVAFVPVPAEAPAETAASPAPEPSLTLASDSDTIVTEPARPVEEVVTEPEAISLAPEPAVGTADLADAPAEESTETAPAAPAQRYQPLDFIGSAEEVLNGPRLFVPVDEELLAHKPARPDEKWIEVNVTGQRVTAWEGNVPVMSFLTSTGLPGTPTVLGEYNIYWKLESTLMTGPGYYLPEVPYTMYFYAGYALHGAYWHDNFGNPMSHGCVNLSIDNAKKLFEWADPVLPEGQTQVVSSPDNPGTLVVVHK